MFPLHDENRPSLTPYVNYGLLLINIVIFFYFFLQGTEALEMGIWAFGTFPRDILVGERLWTIVTSMFMHGSVMHLLGNMVYLWVFGDNIEDVLGHIRYLLFYLLGGLVATFAHIGSLFVTLPTIGYVGFKIPSVGASGAISAVLGAYLLLYPRAKIRTLIFYFFFINIIAIPAYYYLGFWFLYQLMMGVFSLAGLPSGVAFWAHIGGFTAGLFAVKAFGIKRRFTRPTIASRKPFRPLVVSPHVRKPFVDLIVEGDRIKILAELPGVQQEEIEIHASEMEVVISAVQGEVRFYRRILLPTPVVPKVQDIHYKNGVLSFSLRVAR